MTTIDKLTVVETATTDVVDRVVAPARTGLAELALQLRVAVDAAEEAERKAPAYDDPEVLAFLTATLARELDEVRAQLSEELAHAQAEATRRVRAAHAEAEALLTPRPVERVGPDMTAVTEDGCQPLPDLRTEPIVESNGSSNGHTPVEPPAPPQQQDPAAASASPISAPTVLARPVVPDPTPAPQAPAPRRGLRRFLYVDTVLPMVAVLIIVVVLIAWLG